MFGLPRGRDAKVEGRARPRDGLRRGHGSLRKVSLEGRRKQFVEKVAEPALEHFDFRQRDRNGIGPIICDAPCREVVLRRPTGKGTRLAEQGFKLLRWAGRAFCGGASHPATVARFAARW